LDTPTYSSAACIACCELGASAQVRLLLLLLLLPPSAPLLLPLLLPLARALLLLPPPAFGTACVRGTGSRRLQHSTKPA
jgi:hypothetical protein